MDVEIGLLSGHVGALVFGDGVASVFDEDFDSVFVLAGTDGDSALFGAQDGALEVRGEFVFELALVDIEREGGVDEVEVEGDFFAFAKGQGNFV